MQNQANTSCKTFTDFSGKMSRTNRAVTEKWVDVTSLPPWSQVGRPPLGSGADQCGASSGCSCPCGSNLLSTIALLFAAWDWIELNAWFLNDTDRLKWIGFYRKDQEWCLVVLGATHCLHWAHTTWQLLLRLGALGRSPLQQSHRPRHSSPSGPGSGLAAASSSPGAAPGSPWDRAALSVPLELPLPAGGVCSEPGTKPGRNWVFSDGSFHSKPLFFLS